MFILLTYCPSQISHVLDNATFLLPVEKPVKSIYSLPLPVKLMTHTPEIGADFSYHRCHLVRKKSAPNINMDDAKIDDDAAAAACLIAINSPNYTNKMKTMASTNHRSP